jgi:predicted nucleic acid-binding protein
MFLADTDLISEPRQKKPNPRVLDWLREHDHELFLSAITVGEIKKGIELYPAFTFRTMTACSNRWESFFAR